MSGCARVLPLLLAAAFGCGRGSDNSMFSGQGSNASPAPGPAAPAPDSGNAAPAPTGPAAPAPTPPAPSSPKPPPPAPPPETVPEARSLFWNWPCARAPAPGTPADPEAEVITGPGVFVMTPPSGGVKLQVGGTLCDPSHMARSVVFVVDISESMRDFLNLGHDPLRSGTCGRNDAVAAVVQTLPPDAGVAFVTFDSEVEQDSGGFATPAEFAAKYESADIFCARGNTTNYQVALARALAFLQTAPADAAKEVYFISDGEPDSDAVAGLDEAASIRQLGILATIMLKGDDTLMKTELASKDGNGQPYHVTVQDSSTLAQNLATLATVAPVSGTFSYGAVGQTPVSVPLAPATSMQFGVPLTTVDPTQDPQGYQVTLEVVDNRGVTTTTTGSLSWK